MHDLAILGVRAVNGGLFVVLFALVAEVLRPKRFAGLFAAAPSVALANLIVVVVTSGDHDARVGAASMAIGACAMATGCLVGIRLVRRLRALRGSLALCAVWVTVVVPAYVVLHA